VTIGIAVYKSKQVPEGRKISEDFALRDCEHLSLHQSEEKWCWCNTRVRNKRIRLSHYAKDSQERGRPRL
jgi:hypothetical protein